MIVSRVVKSPLLVLPTKYFNCTFEKKEIVSDVVKFGKDQQVFN